MPSSPEAQIIQGGMGVNISCPLLAQKVSCLGQLGTISGTALDRLVAFMLQDGDRTGEIRLALSHFPFPHIADMVIGNFFIERGDPRADNPRAIPQFTVDPPKILKALTICANFAFVWLAKQGHSGKISINYLEKLQMPHVYAITGAVLAGVDYVTMGAGIPLKIPELLSNLVEGKEVTYPVNVLGLPEPHKIRFSPKEFFGSELPALSLPGFLPIISSNLLAKIFIKKLPPGCIQGFVVETPTAGGHNAPPRTRVKDLFTGAIHHEYGPDDVVRYKELEDTGIPFWIGGSYASPLHLAKARSLGARGIQVGTAFAFSRDSGMDPENRRQILAWAYRGELVVETDFRASPTGFPFKVVHLPGTVSDHSVYEARTRVCSQGALLMPYVRPDGRIGYRCPSEPRQDYVRKGGRLEDTFGRKCICNGLLRNARYGPDYEPTIVTAGDDFSFVHELMEHPADTYGAEDVINYILGPSRQI
jgi:NAD(P)H-dependent flavin oxidoreductase YrpB (nitropropane dioxygenase family)